MASSYYPKIVTSGLVLYLDGANRESYSGSGSTWTDLSGNGSNSTLVNSPTYNGSNLGYLTFNGTTQYASVPHNSRLNNGSAITVEAWAYSTTWSTQTYPFLVGKGLNEEWSIFYSSADAGQIGKFCWRIGLTNNTYSTTTAANNRWYHLVGVMSSSGQFIYVNGALEAGAASAAIPAGSSRALLIGAASNPTISNYMNGLISSVKVYNRALSSAEVSQNFNSLRGRYGV
jgi:hypothetical protein